MKAKSWLSHAHKFTCSPALSCQHDLRGPYSASRHYRKASSLQTYKNGR